MTTIMLKGIQQMRDKCTACVVCSLEDLSVEHKKEHKSIRNSNFVRILQVVTRIPSHTEYNVSYAYL